jgi:glucosyl-3-phosphoglycerate synthase
MADFFQNGVVTTLHNLQADCACRLEPQLIDFSERTPVALVLPALYQEFETPAMSRIVEELSRVRYVRRIVLALGQATDLQYLHARSFFRRLRMPVTVVQVDHPRVLAMLDVLREAGLDPGPPGKGRACWLASGYLHAKSDCDVIALHDCDIKTYSRGMLARLCYPMMHPKLDFEFCKGFYARRSERLHGRVTRLFVTPLVRAMQTVAPGARFLPFADSFRYALAGEFAMRASLARKCRVPSDWGLEVGVLGEVFRHCSMDRVCQIDLAENYDHKHQALSSENPARGLRKMTTDIAAAFFRVLAGEGEVLGADQLRTLQITYSRIAEDMITRYEADALVNGLEFDRHAEELAADAFRVSLSDAAAQFVEEPFGCARIPSWASVQSAMPDFLPALERVIEDTDRAADGPVPINRETHSQFESEESIEPDSPESLPLIASA